MLRLASRLLALSALATTSALLTACPASVNGKVDEEAVDSLLSALFIEDQQDYGEDDTQYTVTGTGTSVLGACEAGTKAQANTNTLLETMYEDIQDAEGVVEYEVKNFPTDYWQVSATAMALDDGLFEGLEQDIDLEDVDDSTIDPTDDEDAVANVRICRVNDHPTVEEDNDVFFVERDQDCWLAKKGTLTVSKYESAKAFTVTAEVELTALDGDGTIKDIDDDAGEVVVNINAAHCPTLEEEIQNMADIIEDALDG
ncbi:MAG: hypothetical protein IT382_20140 [Deltaproteobacteria bacterium]|nr:hypothetical protein [Deltaproteobacteria bacterium]